MGLDLCFGIMTIAFFAVVIVLGYLRSRKG